MRNWEEHYREMDIPWDKGVAAPPLAELLARFGVEVFNGGPVLVPGCGMGHDVRALADRGISAVGLDIAPTAVKLATEKYGGEGADFLLGDFLDPAWREGKSYAAVWEHTCFCAIDPRLRTQYAQAVADVLPEGGVFAGLFYLQPESQQDDGLPPFKSTIEELDGLFGRNFERVDAWVPETGHESRMGREWIGFFRKK